MGESVDYINLEKVSIQNHPEINERWVHDIIADNPSILGLGDLILKDRERLQPKAGRLDLLFQDADTNRRFEVEVQLGKSDESHVIRTIEYWDIERKRYPQYDHCAVIIAEDITSRFLNVLSLFNGFIPIVAIQMNAYKVDDKVTLTFTTVLDELTLGLVEEDEEKEATDRGYWENKRATKQTVALADELLKIIHSFEPDATLKYNKFYIGIAKNGQPFNFVSFKPQKNQLRLQIKLQQSEEVQKLLDSSDLDVMDYDNRWHHFRLRLTKEDIKKNEELLCKLMNMAYENFNK
jgi:predicted transport protein